MLTKASDYKKMKASKHQNLRVIESCHNLALEVIFEEQISFKTLRYGERQQLISI
jgi:hypothetical protein